MAANGTGAVFFLGTRAHYQVLEQPSNYDAENGNASTETIYQNRSVEELWPAGSKDVKYDGNYNQEKVNWYTEDCEVKVLEVRGDSCIKRRTNGRSTEALLCDDVRPAAAALNDVEEKTELKAKPRRVSLLSYLTSLARRKRPSDKHYLQHMESVLNTCTYRESCRCLDCQSRYFECDEDSDGYSSDDDYSKYSVKEDIRTPEEIDDEVFLDSPENDNTSTDLLLDEGIQDETIEEVSETDREDDQQLKVEVAASTTAMFNLLLYHPFSCSIQ